MTRMKPFFHHPGSKYLLASRIGPPRCSTIVEPFAGSTWIVDAPYEHNDHARAKYGADVFDYQALGRWCQELPGQVVVHEQQGATWLPFKELGTARTGRTKNGTMKPCSEVLWTNTPC